MIASDGGPPRKISRLSNLQWWGAVIMRLWAATGCFVRVLLAGCQAPVCEPKKVLFLAGSKATRGKV